MSPPGADLPPFAPLPPTKAKIESQLLVASSPSKSLPAPSKVVFPPLPPSAKVGQWILTGHSFAPQREYFMKYCSGLAQRRVVDHLMWFRFPNQPPSKKLMVPVHYSRLQWIGGPLAEVTVPPAKQKKTVNKNGHEQQQKDDHKRKHENDDTNKSTDKDIDKDTEKDTEKDKITKHDDSSSKYINGNGAGSDSANKESEKDKSEQEKNSTDSDDMKDIDTPTAAASDDTNKERSVATADPSNEAKSSTLSEEKSAEDKSTDEKEEKESSTDEKKSEGGDEDQGKQKETEKINNMDENKEKDKTSTDMDIDSTDKTAPKTDKKQIHADKEEYEDDNDDDDDELALYVRKEPVLLSDKDTPRTFAIVVKFLYCEEICFNYLTFDEIVTLATTAHRWGLVDLYHATFSYVMDQNLLAGGHGIRTFIPLVNQPETPESFRRYFCIAVGYHFDVLYPRLKAEDATESSLRKSTSTSNITIKKDNLNNNDKIINNTNDNTNSNTNISRPLLWDVIIRQKMLSHVIHCIRLYSKKSYDEYLLDVILRYFEQGCNSSNNDNTSTDRSVGIPSKASNQDDDEIVGMLWQLNWDNIDTSLIFQREGISRRWSARAIRLAALASFAPHTESLQVHIPWNIPLQKLLKTDVWSFQTEHVFCGPYICYLHVRKNNGPEVSLFVHIWNRDGKQISDDARHERVRVSCRATEMNCKCDSGKQWSDSNHSFLENLKFEGLLPKYPGLGWSHFLEARRLEEWRNCHGEDCGISISTVLQFVNAKKPFEGPAKRVARSNSPTRLASPIQKKRSGLKMKLRESR